MRYTTESQQGQYKLPNTAVVQLLDGELTIFMRPWGSQDYNQKFVDEISHYLSTAQADVEITSPFDNIENVTSLANKVRVAILLAHDHFFKIENATSFAVGFECAVLLKNKNETAWAAVGRFNILKRSGKHCFAISIAGTDQDEQILLPVDLLGVERDFELRCGSVLVHDEDLIVASAYQGDLAFKKNFNSNQWEINTSEAPLTYWFSTVKSG